MRTIHLDISGPEELERWLLDFGPDARVIEPARLRGAGPTPARTRGEHRSSDRREHTSNARSEDTTGRVVIARARTQEPVSGPRRAPDLVPARMLNEYAYCPRLAYLEWVHGDFADNADTLDGQFQHRNVMSRPAACRILTSRCQSGCTRGRCCCRRRSQVWSHAWT